MASEKGAIMTGMMCECQTLEKMQQADSCLTMGKHNYMHEYA